MDTSNMIFVFGSNLGGIHGAGSALFALRHKGAIWGKGIGHYGNSYAIPTKSVLSRAGRTMKVGGTLPLASIRTHVESFLEYARANPDIEFQVTAPGCGLAGLKHQQVAPMFKDAPDNCWFDILWDDYLNGNHNIWGTFP